jgi:membrane dipeptidase
LQRAGAHLLPAGLRYGSAPVRAKANGGAGRGDLEDRISEQAREVHRRALVVDGHCDAPFRLHRTGSHLDAREAGAQADLAGLLDGGVTASFFAAYVPPAYAGNGSFAFAQRLIDIIRREADRLPSDVFLAARSSDIERAKESEKLALFIGVEGGHAIEDSLEKLDELYEAGARYLTLTHVNTNNWADSSGDVARHNGLTRFGREVVQRMNRLGMIVDVSHVSDRAFHHVLESTSVPVIASHSSCRRLAAHPRNLSDEMIRELAANRGVLMINFFSAFIDDDAARCIRESGPRSPNERAGASSDLAARDRDEWEEYAAWYAAQRCPEGSLEQIVDHVIHAATVGGIEHVGIGSDFDGVPALPAGMKSARDLPRLTDRLLARGVTEREIHAILGTNFLRVFREVENGSRG